VRRRKQTKARGRRAPETYWASTLRMPGDPRTLDATLIVTVLIAIEKFRKP
jgi:hypothetical protein